MIARGFGAAAVLMALVLVLFVVARFIGASASVARSSPIQACWQSGCSSEAREAAAHRAMINLAIWRCACEDSGSCRRPSYCVAIAPEICPSR